MSEITPSSVRPMKPRQRDRSIQSMRAIAVILMVAGHVIGVDGRGLRVADDSVWHYAYLFLADIRMPLFTLISGYVYAMRPVAQSRDYPGLVRGKSRRLLLPLITVGTIYYILERVIPGTNSINHHVPVWHIYLFGFEHLWFLQSIFIIFITIGIVDAFGVLSSRIRWAVVTACSAIAFIVVDIPAKVDVFTVSGAMRLLPFFLLGYGLRRHAVFDIRGGLAAAAAAAAFASAFTVRLCTIFDIYHPSEAVDRMLTVAVGATALVLIYSARRLYQTEILAWLGGFSFTIYLLHVLATSPTRLILGHFGVHATWVLFIAGLVMGIGLPTAFQVAFRNVGWVQTLVLGERRTAPGKLVPSRPRSGLSA